MPEGAQRLPNKHTVVGQVVGYRIPRGETQTCLVGAKSNARYLSQHYRPGSALSTLAASVLADRERYGLAHVDETAIGQWLKQNVDRTNLLLDGSAGIPVLGLLESFLQCRLKPRYEGFKSQSPSA